jgi:uncharacterized membrane protein
MSQAVLVRIFLVWSVVGAVVMSGLVGEGEIAGWLGEGWLAVVVVVVLRAGDAIWMSLAFGLVVVWLWRREGWRGVWWRCGVIVAGSAFIESVGVLTGWPFGEYEYSDAMGLRVWGVLPYTIPLAWCNVLIGAAALVEQVWRRAPRVVVWVGVAVLATLTDVLLEPVAWDVRGYWVWGTGGAPPLENYVAWFVTSLVLAACAFWRPLGKGERGELGVPVLVFVVMNLLFAIAHLGR